MVRAVVDQVQQGRAQFVLLGVTLRAHVGENTRQVVFIHKGQEIVQSSVDIGAQAADRREVSVDLRQGVAARAVEPREPQYLSADDVGEVAPDAAEAGAQIAGVLIIRQL